MGGVATYDVSGVCEEGEWGGWEAMGLGMGVGIGIGMYTCGCGYGIPGEDSSTLHSFRQKDHRHRYEHAYAYTQSLPLDISALSFFSDPPSPPASSAEVTAWLAFVQQY